MRFGPTTHAITMPRRYRPIIGAANTVCVTGSPVGVMTAEMMKMMKRGLYLRKSLFCYGNS